jgi:hypothetical protein
MGVRCCRMGTTAIGEGLSIRFFRRAQPQRSPTDLRSRRSTLITDALKRSAATNSNPTQSPRDRKGCSNAGKAALPRSDSREHSLKQAEARLPVRTQSQWRPLRVLTQCAVCVSSQRSSRQADRIRQAVGTLAFASLNAAPNSTKWETINRAAERAKSRFGPQQCMRACTVGPLAKRRTVSLRASRTCA